MNYFPTFPVEKDACKEHSAPLAEMVGTCLKSAGNRMPNFVAVNFYMVLTQPWEQQISNSNIISFVKFWCREVMEEAFSKFLIEWTDRCFAVVNLLLPARLIIIASLLYSHSTLLIEMRSYGWLLMLQPGEAYGSCKNVTLQTRSPPNMDSTAGSYTGSVQFSRSLAAVVYSPNTILVLCVSCLQLLMFLLWHTPTNLLEEILI